MPIFANNNSPVISKKTEQLFLYVAEKCQEYNNFGATLLNKLLYYIDNINYLKTGKPISDLTYIKQDFGPTPKPKTFLGLRDKLVADGKISLLSVDLFTGNKQKRIVTNQKAEISEFNQEEISFIDDVITQVIKYNAKEISDISHEHLSWKLAKNKEDLPFYSYLLTKAPLEDSDIAWAKQKIANHKNKC